MSLSGDKLYMKIVYFVESYDFVVQTFFNLKSSWGTNNRYNFFFTWHHIF
jgi:hypothetical protein